ncbi:hypothetical protein AC578_1822 [Pseudocercospora eumusae]|uniref:RRM domain-containing protein n=1 Tax=Pseudocercospora eumusae TaxID=321146 RepID=A0A139HKD8_9PEZI|nr:hypothetical protein AC578_1822 [Pseudocercospora eumusae]
MQSIRQIERLNQTELDKCIPPNASWHTDYRDTAYVYIGGLPFELSEGDILTIFSQYGNPVHINLVRDKDTGKSRGFCFLKYEDQRSCDLAVDNLSGAGVMGRVISVDHARYKKKEGEIEGIGDEQEEDANDTDREGDERRKRRKTESESEDEWPMIKEEIELQKLLRDHDDDDPMKEYLVKAKREDVAKALKAVVKHKSKGEDRIGPRGSMMIARAMSDTDLAVLGVKRMTAKEDNPTDVLVEIETRRQVRTEMIVNVYPSRGEMKSRRKVAIRGDAGVSILMTIVQKSEAEQTIDAVDILRYLII